jgi:antitoxin CcdA
MASQMVYYAKDAPKKAVSLSVNSDLLRQAREAGVELSEVFERALEEETRALKRARWLVDNAEAIEAYNEHVARDGVFSDGLRKF